NLNNKNKEVFYILIEIFIRNIAAASDKQKIYNEIVKYCDHIINNVDFYDARAYYYKGWVYFQNGDYASAEFNLKKSIQNNPNFLPALQLLLDLYIRRANFEEAIKTGQKILNKGYINPEIARLVLKLYLNSDKLTEAKEFYSKFSSYLDDEESYYFVSLLHYKFKDYKKALEYINKTLSKYPDNPDYLKLKVKILYSLKKYDESYKIIIDKFKDSKDDEILIIKKDIESNKLRRNLTLLIGSVIVLIAIILGFFYYREQKTKKVKTSIENLKKLYQDRVSTKSENLEILVGYACEFFNEHILNFDTRMLIYVSDPKKDNVLYCYFNNVSNDISDVMYVFPKYSGWTKDYANAPVHVMEIQSNSLFYEWIGGKNLINLKKNKLVFLLPFVSKGLIQAILFIQAINDSEEQKIIQILRNNKEAITELAEEIANDMISTRFKEVALIDELTRLYNRRFMYQKLEEEIQKASKTNQKVSYILCDIDNFKKFNDTYGHQVGDEVLIAVAKVFKGAAREFFDWPFRYGGEEIGIILPNTPSDKAYEIAERIRNEISSKRFENVPTVITISLGIATYPDHAKTVEELIKYADEALYFSKKNGKNRATIYDPKLVKSLQDIIEQKIDQNIQQKQDKKENVNLT
ncbi:MAG: diguanylate cyclase, partial [bacterium]